MAARMVDPRPYIVYIDADTIVMQDISALFLPAPGVTGVVDVKMAHTYTFEHSMVKIVTTFLCIARAHNCRINSIPWRAV